MRAPRLTPLGAPAALAVGAVIGLLVLAAAGAGRGGAGAPGDRDLPPLQRAASHGGVAQLRLARASASVFLFDRRLWPTEIWTPAVKDATETGRWVGVGAGVAIAVLPGPARGPLPVRVAVVPSAPPLRAGDDHVVDVDLDVGSGELVLVGSGAVRGHVVRVPAGAYRVRVAGSGYRIARGAGALRIELWPRREARPPQVRRRWAGWAG